MEGTISPNPQSIPKVNLVVNRKTVSARFVRIDVLRAVAAISVVFYHFIGAKVGWHADWSPSGVAQVDLTSWRSILATIMSVGWAGVPLFFVLSGFCIHGAFLRQSTFHAGTFFWRRFWRIYPPFLVAIAVFCFWPIPHLGGDTSWSDLLAYGSTVFVLSPDGFWCSLNPSFWSVGVEFQCYLLYPAFLWLRERVGIHHAALGWFVVAAVGQISAGAHFGWPDHAINFWSCASFFSFGAWALGALVAESLMSLQSRLRIGWSALILSGIACFLSSLWMPGVTLSFSLAAVTGAILVCRYADSAAPAATWERLLAKCGLVSFSLYLWHQPLLGPLETLGRNMSIGLPLQLARISTVLVISISLGFIATASYFLFERPGMVVASWFRREGLRFRSGSQHGGGSRSRLVSRVMEDAHGSR